MKKRVLFLCVYNSCRSQMAEGWLNHLAPEEFEAYSAGDTATMVSPLAMTVMRETGVDLSSHRSKTVSEFYEQEFDYVITCCGQSAEQTCPVFWGKTQSRLHWNFEDPGKLKGNAEEILNGFRRIRDEIKRAVEDFIRESRN